MSRQIFPLSLLFLGLTFLPAPAQTVYMKDTPADTGAEPNPDTGPMWVSQDIWVRNSPDPGYTPYPFAAGSPPWTFPAHQNPVYRDPLKSTPNYVYVEVRNDSAVASTGTERLRVYWAKASTGLAWPSQWVDYQPGGPLTLLYGAEITKPRKNAATASAAERNAYVQAILHIGTDPAYTFPMGLDYWHSQQDIHSNMGSFSNIHETLAFEPWHREFINRYELLLQQYDPTVKLLYWDWTTSPTSSLSFMGSYSGSIGSPFLPALAPPAVSRNTAGGIPAETDGTVLARTAYGPYTYSPCVPSASAPFMAALEDCSHNYSHGYVGGPAAAPADNMSHPNISAEDPFFFLLHGNVDRLWAQWQRDPSHLPRLDPAQTYGASLGSDVNLQLTMSPWDGSPGGSTSASNVQIQPWETTTSAPSGGTYVVAKTPDDPSVVSPPIYDVAPLTVPKLQPGQAVVLQIPWYPPDPSNFSSFGTDAGHFCLIARIETSATAPYGMDTPETADVYANTKNNNKIVWKNVEIVDDVPGPMMMKSFLVRNVFEKPTQVSLRFVETRGAALSLLKQGRIFVDLKPQLFERWRRTAVAERTVRPAVGAAASRVEILSSDAAIRNITLAPHETFSVNVEFELSKTYLPRTGPPIQFDLIQLGAPGNPDQIVGGQRYTLDLSRLVPVKSGAQWRYWDNGGDPEGAWTSLDYDDAKWKHGTTPFGSAAEPATKIGAAPAGRRFTTAYFRHSFDVADPSFYRNALLRLKYADGAVVFLNGKEIYRGGLAAAAANADTTAIRRLAGLERHVFVPVKIDPALLRRGKNVVAAEIHAGSPEYADLGFDLELLANDSGAGFPPEIAFAAPRGGAVLQAGEIVPIELEAYSGDAKIASVSLYADDRLVGRLERAPYKFDWPAGSIGAHRLRAVAVDDRKLESSSFRTVTVVDHLLPSVELVEARSMTAAREGEAVSLSARASDRNGKIARVEFWVKDMATWTSPAIRVASVTAAPYTALIKGLKPGHYMVWAIAVNDHDGTTQSFPGHIMINASR